MTYVKKLNPEWNPQEHQGISVGDVVDFPGNPQKLVEEGSVTICDEQGNELSAYESLGVVTEREMNEFKAWVQMKGQERLKKNLEAEKDELLAEAEKIKQEVLAQTAPTEDAAEKLAAKKKEFAKRMAEGRAKKKAEKAKNG